MPNNLFVEESNLAIGFGPVDMSTAANNGDWISVKGFDRVTCVLVKAAGTAGDDPVLTLMQATDVTGAGSKALPFTRVEYKRGDLTTVGTFTTVNQAAANTYVDTVSAEAAGIFVIEVLAEYLDVNNGYDCIRFSVPDVGVNAQLGCAFYILRGGRYGSKVSALVD